MAGAVLVVDSYRIAGQDLSELRGRAGALVLVDDLGDRRLDVDVVVNQNLGGDELTLDLGEGTVVLAGTRYALLRREFAALREQALAAVPDLADLAGRPRRVLVLMGGTDPTGSARTVAQACAAAFVEAEVDVVVPGSVGVGQEGRVRVLPRVQDVALPCWTPTSS